MQKTIFTFAAKFDKENALFFYVDKNGIKANNTASDIVHILRMFLHFTILTNFSNLFIKYSNFFFYLKIIS